MTSYKAALAAFAPAMKGDQADRVPLLRQILANLGHPDQRFQIVHVAGTNGKGSTGQIIAEALLAKGFRVGHFASPALLDEREQVQINHQLITPAQVVAAVAQIKAHLPAGVTLGKLTIFEGWTLIALVTFARQQVDWAVIEVGLGGQLDATNAISAPALAVITHLALDHTRILGPTLTAVAHAKAGIIKSGTPAVVLAPEQAPAARTVIAQAAKQAQVPLVDSAAVVQVHPTLAGQVAIQVGTEPGWQSPFGLSGQFQRLNLVTALAALRQLPLAWSVAELQVALGRVRLPGRFEQINAQPPVILDGAHNPDGTRHLLAALQERYPAAQPTFILGFLADKAVATLAQQYQALGATYYLVTPNHPTRALPAEKLKDYLPTGQVMPSVAMALTKALAVATPKTVIVITGSFYVVKEGKRLAATKFYSGNQ